VNVIRFSTKTLLNKCPSKSRKGSLSFASINLLMELFVNCSESKDRASFGKTANGLSSVAMLTQCRYGPLIMQHHVNPV
jgi:hypothetical protein